MLPRKRIPPPPAAAARILAELLALPSVHPEAPAGGSVPGEAAIAAWVAAHLRSLGAGVEARELAPGRPSVVARFDPVGRTTATVLLMPHLDTVGVAGMTVPPFRMTKSAGGRLYGRGACDTKGPMAALLAALGRWARQPATARGSICWIVAATAGEEQGSLGAAALFDSGLKADFAVALEPTGLKVVHAAKGVLRLWIDVPGRAAHGSRPERGRNAVFAALPLLASIRDNLAPWLAAQSHPVLGRASVNLGTVHSGGEWNVVPDRCRIGLDVRVHPGVRPDNVVARLRSILRRLGVQARIQVVRSKPSFLTQTDHPWARCLRACGRGWTAVDWFCDANVAAAAGIPAVAFGPGSIRQAHTVDEYILESDLAAGTDAFLRFLTAGPA